jgi:hypothetical protein
MKYKNSFNYSSSIFPNEDPQEEEKEEEEEKQDVFYP